jgi:hypothetical protein
MRAVREHPEKSGNMLIDLERYRVISRTIQGLTLTFIIQIKDGSGLMIF